MSFSTSSQGVVKAIDKRTVHQICSGQVVLSLAVAVKELVENSIDAGATIVEVKLRDHGLGLVEISDNGCGVTPENFSALTLKHHTSKLSEFDDLRSVATFGFRGEALSSLCALSDLEVITCHKSQPVATRIEYDSNGHIKSQTHCAREVGTTVSLRNLFHTLPVRCKEFQRNIKKEFSRMIHVLQAYCLISTGVRLSCYNQTGQSKRQLIVATNGSSSVKENIISIFGQKQFQSCVELRECGREAMEDVVDASEVDQVTLDGMQTFRLTGYVSRCTHGCGRSTTDRQFYYCNGRPIELPRLAKTVNEVYHKYNRHQNPFIILNFNTKRECIDVNVTPDKRHIIIQQEKSLLLLVKASLQTVYDPMQSEIEASPIGITSEAHNSSTDTPTSSPSLWKLSSQKQEAEIHKPPQTKQPRLFQYGIETRENGHSCTQQREEERKSCDSPIIPTFCNSPTHTTHNQPTTGSISTHSSSSVSNEDSTPSTIRHTPETPLPSKHMPQPLLPLTTKSCSLYKENALDSGSKTTWSCAGLGRSSRDKANSNTTTTIQKTPPAQLETIARYRREHSVVCDVNLISQRLKTRREGGDREGGEINGSGREKMRFRAKIRASESESAEKELRREISKSTFKEMKVVGQFNLGFIIAQFGENLFIIDQHASDEQFNYERLQRDAVIDNQKLLHPKTLEVTCVGENVILDNLNVFRMNGFHFKVDTSAPPTKRLKLTSQPVYRGVKFGTDEIDEMIFLLTDSPGEVVRPSKVSQMFASRACRVSVMIGKALNKIEMKKVISNMEILKKPWNCPHGRPTLRHLVDLSCL